MPDAMNQTLVICKPDAVERGLTGEIISRIERKGLRIVAAEMRIIDKETAGEHYSEHKDKPFYSELVTFFTRSQALIMIVEGPDHETCKVVRTLMGATNPKDAAPGTIRGDLAIITTENLIHGSDSEASAEREIKLFFPHLAS